MNRNLVDRITAAVLYEGYLLYPYRASALKNRQRWTFGGLYPPSWSEAQGGADPCSMRTECLLQKQEDTILQVRVRFLHLQEQTVRGAGIQSRQEAVEREVILPELAAGALLGRPYCHSFAFPAARTEERQGDPDGQPARLLVRLQESFQGVVELIAESVADNLLRIKVEILNETPMEDAGRRNRDEALLHALVSTHTILHVRNGAFVSLLDPPDGWRELAAGCCNVGTWPVLVGAVGEKDTLLSSPIILYDYPQIATESPGDLFDATEIDEILTLRILAMTDQEKREVSAGDERGRALLERTETLAREQLMNLHGAVRGLRPMVEKQAHD